MLSKILSTILVILVIGIVVNYFYRLPKYANGEEAPKFEATLMDGSPFALTDLKGKYVLIDFWGSWCGPCRRENPELVELYKKYNKGNFKKANGFEIVGIAVERNEKRWKAAIEKDGLTWPYQIAQLDRFKSPIVQQYGVKEIPTKYLLNENGQIVGVNMENAAIDKFLEERLR